nr:DNA helicase [Tanacetum cinerariifolium]
MTRIDYTSPSGDELCGGHHFHVMPLGDSNVTVFFVCTTNGDELPRAGVQNLGVGTDGRAPLSIGSHDMMDTTNVPVSMVFDRFRNIRLNSYGSTYICHSDLKSYNSRLGSTYEGDSPRENTHDIAGMFHYSKVFLATLVSDTSSLGAHSMRRPSIQVRSPSYIDLEGHHPWFLQLYIYDTQAEVSNIMQNFRGREEETLNPKIVEGLIHVLDEHNGEQTVQILDMHLENMQHVNFREKDRLNVIVNMPDKKKMTLTEWHVYNNEHTDGRHLTYLDFPSEFVCDLFYFRMLLSHQKGRRSPVEVRTVNGQVLPTYRAACEALEAMKDDILGKVSKEIGIFNYHLNTPELQGYILYELEAILNGFEKSVKEFGLPTPPEHLLKDLKNRLLMEEKNYRRDILLSLRSQGKIVLAVASSGIATLLLLAGRTTHSRFKLPLKLTDEIVCHAKNTISEEIYFKVCTLKQNTRLLRSGLRDEEQERSKLFAEWILNVGNGEIGYLDKDNELIDFIYDDATLKAPTANAFQEKAIVCPKNDAADVVNAKILSSVEGVAKTYLSRDEAIQMGRETSETKMLYPLEYLNTITFPGFPPYELQLKDASAPSAILHLLEMQTLGQKYQRKVDIESLDGNVVEFTMFDDLAK